MILIYIYDGIMLNVYKVLLIIYYGVGVVIMGSV